MLIWIDFTCPFSYLGIKKLFSIIEENNYNLNLEIKSFLLNPDLKGKQDYIKSLSEKYNIPYSKAENMAYGATKMASEDNIKLDFKNLRMVSSTNAHKLIKHFENNEKYHSLIIKIFEKYFLEQKNISNINVLEDILAELNIDNSSVKEITENNKYLEEINKDMYQASTFKINSTPTILLRNGKKFIGSRTKEQYIDIIKQSLEMNS
ncbi:DsbA family oxidoreductase [Miniphocaeibacter halophilus]|uniref:DsbA family protein n=1 Tax=Miniphocaeibacter halophilus TaxID=2931922 RepID=A0AC61MR02_9FIRM|nr:DsbA family protein [Miniphocaeibacter halophilus]QQK07379.1 DsbA family protein [Miniphocaeibacter halophilus]